MPLCPSVAELIAKVKSLTKHTDGTFQTTWSGSFIDPFHCCERGGFIYVDFPVPAKLTRCYIVPAQAGTTMNQRTAGPNASIDLNRPGITKNKVILVANFHTHPLSTNVRGDPHPSRADMTNAFARGVPGIVISRPGIWSYGPERRENTKNPKGYPGGSEPVSFRSALVKSHPPPWTVKNQWPEGTGHVHQDKLSDGVEGNGEAIVLEWSPDGVEYGEPLTESEN